MARYFSCSLLLVIAAPPQAETISGAGRAIDGDSLTVGQVEIRLHGIDAPELNQTCSRDGSPWACGMAAADQLAKLISGRPVNCIGLGQDRFGQTLAQCRAGDTDLNRAMVAAGYALAYRRYSTNYVSAEEIAKVTRRGIWAGTFELPSELRHTGEDYRVERPPSQMRSGKRPPVRSTPKSKSSSNCRIKGNHSRKGERIYHLPGMPYYTQTVAEQIFCTEVQARAAGYRVSRADRHR